MSVLVDTSVWVDYLNGHPSPEAAALDRLLLAGTVATSGVIVAEVFQGLRRNAMHLALEARFRSLDCLEPGGLDAYLAAAQLYRELRARGITIRSTIDCLIVTVAARHSAWILAKDRDLTAIVRSGLVPVQAWPIEAA